MSVEGAERTLQEEGGSSSGMLASAAESFSGMEGDGERGEREMELVVMLPSFVMILKTTDCIL